ncbi:MAG: hypothetical protein KKB30_09480 [Proteobacteria bacterium]|nr:hypothetical protein [Pseudomonadota bacterium]MBU1716953.1 hypothetical protein [Pseudomonadota bacterium]
MSDLSNKIISDKQFRAAGHATLIGSLPVNDHNKALDLILASTPHIPLWPQLPSNPLEGMLSQFIEGIPGIVEQENSTFFETATENFEPELLAFFEEYLAVIESPSKLLSSRFQVSEKRGGGLYRFKEIVAGKNELIALKGQITGPFTLLTGLHDKDKRLGYYDPTIREMVVKALAMKAAWQVTFLKESKLPVIIFIDEPALAGLGSSSFISISLDDISQDLTEVITAIQEAGGLAGVHVCANTDWNLLLSIGLDVLSFDAYGFFDRLIADKKPVYEYLNNGGILAWGIVPTANAEIITGETTASLVTLWEKQAAQLTNDQWDLAALLNQTMITPSCGTGSLSLELAQRVLNLTHDVSETLRHKYPA